MKVLCVESFGSFLTSGRSYEVVEENGDLYKVLDNTGIARYFNKSNFKEDIKMYYGGRGSGKPQFVTDLRSSAEVRRESAVDQTLMVTDAILVTQILQDCVPVKVVQEKPRNLSEIEQEIVKANPVRYSTDSSDPDVFFRHNADGTTEKGEATDNGDFVSHGYTRTPEQPRREDSWFTPTSYDSGAPSSYDSFSSTSWD